MNTRLARKGKKNVWDWRMKALRFFFIFFAIILIARLFMLQVVNAAFYEQLASGQHSFYQELFAERGSIFVRDWMGEGEYLAATNEPRAFVFVDPRRVEDPEASATKLASALGYDVKKTEDQLHEEIAELEAAIVALENGEMVAPLGLEEAREADEEQEEGPTEYEVLLERLSKVDDPYEPVARDVDDATLQKILALDVAGIDYVLEKSRSYPESEIGGHLLGFLGLDSQGRKVGQYGVEGYWEDFLAGQNGFVDSETDATGRWIGVGSRTFDPAVDGGDLLLTIDRTVQYTACQALAQGVERFDADGGSLVILEPSTGRVMAMCSVPDFDPNTYNEVEDISVYNNAAVSTPYEPGSVFKPLIMAAALDLGVLNPNTIFEDTGEEKIDQYTIRNSDLKSYGWQSMTQVLEKSLNTGMIFVMRQMEFGDMRRYIEDFGFGTLSGIGLSAEAAGDLASLNIEHEIYYATASYGQGLTTTPLQIAAAYAALANGGLLMQPYVVEEKRFSDGTVEKIKPTSVRQVVSKSTATTIGAMMVSVVENGHGDLAAVPGYYLAGKTGTAQVAKEQGGGYQEDYTKATFAGFGPVDDPKFAMVVLLDRPRAVPWAADTSAPIWGDIAEFLLQYFEVAPRHTVE